MAEQEGVPTDAENGSGGRRLLILFAAGFLTVFVGIAIMMVAAMLSDGSASFGGFVLIGPVPIVFGAGPQAAWLALFAVVLAVISIAVFLIMRRRVERSSD